MARNRTDVHRPTEINPEDYQFVCVQYLWQTSEPDLGELFFNRQQREVFIEHKEKTGGKFANIEHGGTCFCCGAHARYVARYYHAKTNSYIDLGERCSIKLDDGESNAFRTIRRAVTNAREAIAGKRKAKLIFEEAGLVKAWDLYEANRYPEAREERIVVDIVGKVVRYGSASDNSLKLVAKLINYIENKDQIEAERKAKREAEKAAAAPCPEGRVKVTGTILTVKVREHKFGYDLKVLVKDESGFTVWGNLPKDFNLLIEWVDDPNSDEKYPRLKVKEPKVEFVATITPSKDDTKFGFFKRPSKSKLFAETQPQENQSAS